MVVFNLFKIYSNKCLVCGTCVGICPSSALLIKDEKVIFFDDKCVWCKLCEGICSVRAISITKYKVEEK